MNLKSYKRNSRRGNIAVMSIFLLVVLLTMVAFTVNIGRLTNSIAKLQNINDAASKAAAWGLLENYSKWNQFDLATHEATAMVSKSFVEKGVEDAIIPEQDLKFGTYRWNSESKSFDVDWGASPANLVQARLSRINPRNNALDVVLTRFLGRETMQLNSISNVIFMPASGFQAPSGDQTLDILPFTLDIDTWIALENGIGNDDYSVDPETKEVNPWGDGKLEVKIFPIGNDKSLPSGNRGTLRLGADNNSAQKLRRQILHGLSAEDMSYHPNGFCVADGPLYLPGNPGVTAAVEKELNQILGQDRILPLFRSVSGNGANATYEIVKFVGVKVVKADLRGALRHKEVLLQPSNFVVDQAVTNMKMPANELGTIFVKPMFVGID